MQVQTTNACIGPAIKKIWKEGGFLGFFRGNGINVVKVAPESAIKFFAYEMLKNVIGDSMEKDKDDIGAFGRLFAGGMAGAVAQTAIYPLDLVKTRLQTFSSDGGKVPKLGTLTKDILVQEGPRAFYKGLLPSVLGMIPYAGIDLAAYETLKDMSKSYILRDSGTSSLYIYAFICILIFFLYIMCTYVVGEYSQVPIVIIYIYIILFFFFFFCRTWSSCPTGMWDNIWSYRSNLCVSLAGYTNKV